MEQETSPELLDIQSLEPLFVTMRGIAPAEGDVAFGERDQPGVRDGDAMGVGAEITQPMFRSTEALRGPAKDVGSKKLILLSNEGALKQSLLNLQRTRERPTDASISQRNS